MTRRPRPGNRLRVGALVAVLALAASCSDGVRSTGEAQPDDGPSHVDDHGADLADAPPGRPAREGERFQRLVLPAPYTPAPPFDAGTDDYRCFLLDPGLTEDAFVTGLDVLPGTPEVVHHVILFRVPPASVPTAEARDAEEDGQGWTCFGGSGVDTGVTLDNAPWLGAWAPGGGETVMDPDVGMSLEAGSRVIMQVHYNLLEGAEPDRTAAVLRLADGDRDLAALETLLMPAPVELPCRPAYDDGPLCERRAALADVEERFGTSFTANALHLLCGRQEPGPVQRCDRPVTEPSTVRAVAGHMHLLGRSITVEANPDTPRARTLLDIEVWDFDDQAAKPVQPLRLREGDTLRVTCRHDQSLRDRLPAFEGQPDRWVVWGEGSTDEMCLSMVLLTRP